MYFKNCIDIFKHFCLSGHYCHHSSILFFPKEQSLHLNSEFQVRKHFMFQLSVILNSGAFG